MSLDYGKFHRSYLKKIFSKPAPMARLMKRTFSTACAILNDLERRDYREITVSLHNFLSALPWNRRLIDSLEAQMELAGANQDRFVRGIHQFYNNISLLIKKEKLYKDLFGLLRDCFESEEEIVTCTISLIMQVFEYLRPNKYNFDSMVCGVSANGETLLLCNDPFSKIDLPTFDLTKREVNGDALKGDTVEFVIQGMQQLGFDVHSRLQVVEEISFSQIWENNVFQMASFINEFTFDMLPRLPYRGPAILEIPKVTGEELGLIKELLVNRRRTLPANGTLVELKNADMLKSVFFKEILCDNEMVILYRVGSTYGDLSGYYKTASRLFMAMFNKSNYKEQSLRLEKLILWLYCALVCDDRKISLERFGDFFRIGDSVTPTASAKMFYGQVRNVYNHDVQREVAEDRYSRELRTINGFIRRLPHGMEVSQEAVTAAASLGFRLEPGETFVRPFKKTVRTLTRMGNEYKNRG